jgi:hypothetical protein
MAVRFGFKRAGDIGSRAGRESAGFVTSLHGDLPAQLPEPWPKPLLTLRISLAQPFPGLALEIEFLTPEMFLQPIER